ncbi:ribose import ATP-binding protein RbsA [Capsulimonas corticalis]|uniref:Ribose import ATP-binding protein RbsA n=1 Tax=Capsulimonas corticalis TaxID=2219043 RepID=A0A402D402_9BACT|nr:sugar ABC transporter ATP-binding protein [Capsulimonas corticalis]BDI31195.1 ribose import ATP-binding protein RbsA [Capsulimonas corticalis]
MMNTPFLQVSGLSKAYNGVPALSGVSLAIEPGEVHALMGENGAGKSTLIKCLSGVVRPDGGSVQVDGAAVSSGDIRVSEAAGIVALHQESTAFAHLNAIDNIFVGREPRLGPGLLDRPRMRREAQALLDRLGERIDLDRPLEELSLAQRQMVGIARALSHKSRLLIMDEPTASLSARETQTLFRIIRQLQSEGVAILYVSHRMEEVFALSSRVTILRDGKLVETRAIADVSRNELVKLMVGRELLAEESRESATAPGEVMLDVRGLTRPGVFRDITFSVRKGEIVGLAGLVGAGRSEVAASIFGVDRPESGSVRVAGDTLAPGSVPKAIGRGVALVPEDRQHQGLVLPLTVGTNLLLSVLGSPAMGRFRAREKETTVVTDLMRDLSVKAAGPDIAANTLSGGNQQKLALGKWLAASPRVLILDEPTRGVDVGAKADVYRIIRQLASDGMATLLISSDLPELLTLSDRILVMREGTISGELSRAEATEEKILALALHSQNSMTGEAIA